MFALNGNTRMNDLPYKKTTIFFYLYIVIVQVVEILEADKTTKIPVKPIFISVDPARDTRARVKQYCEEFSPKLQGYTGTPEQVS